MGDRIALLTLTGATPRGVLETTSYAKVGMGVSCDLLSMKGNSKPFKQKEITVSRKLVKLVVDLMVLRIY